jgi:hypothetical protein
MKPYVFLFTIGAVLLAVVFGLALGSRPLVESIWDVYLLETPSGYKVARQSEIDALPAIPDPDDLPGMELRPGALILLYLGDVASEYLLPCALLGFGAVSVSAAVCVAKGLRHSQSTRNVEPSV